MSPDRYCESCEEFFDVVAFEDPPICECGEESIAAEFSGKEPDCVTYAKENAR